MLPSEDVRLKRTTSFESNDLFNLKLSKGFYNQYIQNTLQLNSGDGHFTEIANMAGTEASDWSWGALIFDADNDGWQDLLVCNGIYKDVIDQDFIDFFANEVMQKMVLSGKKQKLDTVVGLMPSTPIPNKMFRNMGDLQYQDVATDWGLDQPGFSNGAAYGDLDNDGDLDLIVNNVNGPSFVYQNNANQSAQHFSVRLKGQSPNTFAIGARVEVYTKDQSYTKEIMPSRGFQSSVDYTQVFGLGKNTVVDSMVVYWPDATRQVWMKPAMNQVLVAEMSTQRTKVTMPISKGQAIFQQVALPGKWKHKEDEHVDFYYERGLHEMLSKEGPPIAAADLNKDGIDEIFVGAASGQRPVLYWSAGTGFKADTTTFSYTDFEDTAAAFFDADGDGDLDLFVGSGGNHHPPLTREMQDRVYLNNANQFTLSTRALPVNGMNTSVCIPIDYDADGDTDLFVGSRSYPQQYGTAPDNYLYENNGKGSFQNVAKTVCPDLANAGFVTSATLVDLDGDKNNELVVACAWGEIQAFSFKGKKGNKLSSLLPKGYSGMWSYVSHADLDNDGDQDLVCGNMGLNSGLSEYPLTLWVGDFDANKTVDKIISRQINDRNCPVMMKREFMEQLPSLKKNSLKHEEFAHKTIEDLLPADIRKKAQTWKADYFGSVVMINKGKMQFDVKPLPRMFQTSHMSGAVLVDVNKDGFTDIIPIGNRSVYAPQFGRLDGYCGDVIINDKGVAFGRLPARETGLDLRGDARAAYLIKGKKTPTFMVTFNNSQAKLYAQR
ncbi:MAG TPA: VCBS repeat-containing protein [Saprospiraceae bacterium]|nr:VCBS repeat-containing protein [Saprospiraceae bacterium]